VIKLSVIVPCRNEKQWISICLNALLKQSVSEPPLEILVVDNGSTDGTIEILQSFGSKIKYYVMPNASISELRNFGVQQAQGDWLAFIDSDVEVHKDWYKELNRSIRKFRDERYDLLKVVTGSTYLIPGTPSWVEQVWFQQLVARDQKQMNYINGGNLILSRQFFDRIGGFAPEYRTGEDVRFCQDALDKGGKIVKVAEIQATHHGYPKTIREFFKRERWHGLGMKHYLLKPWQMRDLVLALYFLIVTGLLLIFMLLIGNVLIITGIWLVMLIFPIFIFALSRSRDRPGILLPLTFLYFVYGWARVFSLFDIIQRQHLR
jgi:glycosyltransferase involved in cell wall biosynthesis